MEERALRAWREPDAAATSELSDAADLLSLFIALVPRAAELRSAKQSQARSNTCPFISTDEFLHGLDRWILYLDGAAPADFRAMPQVKERIAKG